MAKNVVTQNIPMMNPQIAGGQNVQEEVKQIELTGQWVPSVDPAKLGDNFQTLKNMRYTDTNIVGVLGMEVVNTVPLDYPKVRSAHNFNKTSPTESHLLVQAFNENETLSRIYANGIMTPDTNQLRLSTGESSLNDDYARVTKIFNSGVIPDLFTLEIDVQCYAVGTIANEDYFELRYSTATWTFAVILSYQTVAVRGPAEAVVSVNPTAVIVGVDAPWQTWRFEVDKTDEGDARCVVYRNDMNITPGPGDYVDCSCGTGGTPGEVSMTQYGSTTDNMTTRVRSLRIGTGLGIMQ